jgi:hypothetical protein
MNLTGKIALAHLKEFPDYYTRLATLEAEADKHWGQEKNKRYDRGGICP